jgi:glyoxylase-like metal-dependent hydrolase (beta-lactamase superfamily II)
MEETEAAADSVPSERIVPFNEHETLEMGGFVWQILHTPGHASSLTCFYQPDTRQFLSTDMLLPLTPTPIVEVPPNGQLKRVPSLPQFLDSLDRVEKLQCDIVYPGHGQPFDNPLEVIQHQRSRIAVRKGECLALIEQGAQMVADLLLAMYPNYPPRFRFAGLWMVIGYLDLLQAEGQIEWVEEAGLIRPI